MGRDRGWLSSLGRALPHPRKTPFTFWYLILLAITTVVQHAASPAVVNRLLMHSSTDPHNLWQRPIQTLITSAFWLVDAKWTLYAVFFTLVLAPLERRSGPLWTVAIFFSGHIVATLATEIPVTIAKYLSWVSREDTHWLDVGVSYGFFTATGVLLLMLSGTTRRWGIIIVETGIVLLYISGDPGSLLDIVTVFGHLIALHFGMFAWLRWSKRRNLVGSIELRWPAFGSTRQKTFGVKPNSAPSPENLNTTKN